jgi:hypothetical protein
MVNGGRLGAIAASVEAEGGQVVSKGDRELPMARQEGVEADRSSVNGRRAMRFARHAALEEPLKPTPRHRKKLERALETEH